MPSIPELLYWTKELIAHSTLAEGRTSAATRQLHRLVCRTAAETAIPLVIPELGK